MCCFIWWSRQKTSQGCDSKRTIEVHIRVRIGSSSRSISPVFDTKRLGRSLFKEVMTISCVYMLIINRICLLTTAVCISFFGRYRSITSAFQERYHPSFRHPNSIKRERGGALLQHIGRSFDNWNSIKVPLRINHERSRLDDITPFIDWRHMWTLQRGRKNVSKYSWILFSSLFLIS